MDLKWLKCEISDNFAKKLTFSNVYIVLNIWKQNTQQDFTSYRPNWISLQTLHQLFCFILLISVFLSVYLFCCAGDVS